jgi:hypothetical protein
MHVTCSGIVRFDEVRYPYEEKHAEFKNYKSGSLRSTLFKMAAAVILESRFMRFQVGIDYSFQVIVAPSAQTQQVLLVKNGKSF